jgi:hypothetical protein
MSYERAIAARKEEVAIMKKRLKEVATDEEKSEIQRRIKLVEDAIKQLQISAKVREQIEEIG